MREIACIIVAALLGDDFESERGPLMERSRGLMERYPLYPHLSSAMWQPVIAFRTTRRIKGGIYRWKQKHTLNSRS